MASHILTYLRKKIIRVLKKQGFKINPHLRPGGISKRIYKRIQKYARDEQLTQQKEFLLKYLPIAKEFCRDGKDIIPENIRLELREVQPETLDYNLFRWWNYVWWSIPYQRSYGRQMRFMLWDTTHNAPFGLICLQSPVLKMAVRDNYLELPKDKLDIWVNKSLNAQRVGALPPYNNLLGGKMVALSLTANEIRDAYRKKYRNYISIIERRKLSPDLLFITTTSAFGKSSLYNRLKYNGNLVAEPLGYTKGSGSFHIPEDVYEELIKFLKRKKIDVARGYGNGPSRKLKLISLGLHYLGFPAFEYHGIKREFYLFPLARNLKEIIKNRKKPLWYNRSFDKLTDYWKERWAIPRSERIQEWQKFSASKFLNKTEKFLEAL